MLHDELLAAACDPVQDSDKGKLSTSLVSPTVPSPPVPNHWAAPPLFKAKLNTDAAFLRETGDTWGGAMAMDHMGHFFMFVGQRLARCSSVEEAEGAAALLGLT